MNCSCMHDRPSPIHDDIHMFYELSTLIGDHISTFLSGHRVNELDPSIAGDPIPPHVLYGMYSAAFIPMINGRRYRFTKPISKVYRGETHDVVFTIDLEVVEEKSPRPEIIGSMTDPLLEATRNLCRSIERYEKQIMQALGIVKEDDHD